MTKWFLDAGFAIALIAPRDAMHSRGKRLAERIEQENVQLVTTTAVLLEVGDELSKRAELIATVTFVDHCSPILAWR
jgi:predicted nucleic acid-binding protein